MSLRKVTENRGHFPSDEAMFKLIYLTMKIIAKKWTMPIRDWKSAFNQFSIIFQETKDIAAKAAHKVLASSGVSE